MNKVDPIISCDSGAVLRLDSSKNYEAVEIAQGIDKSAMIVLTSEDNGAISIAFNNEIQVYEKNNSLASTHSVDENIAAILTTGNNNLIYSTFDGHIISKKM